MNNMVLLMSLSFVEPIVIDSFFLATFFATLFELNSFMFIFFIFFFPFGTFFVVVTVNGNLQLGLD